MLNFNFKLFCSCRSLVPVSLARLTCCVLLLASCPLSGFWISVHRDITQRAVDAFPDAQISKTEKDLIVQGSTDADLVEGALPFRGGPYEARFHYDNDFSYEAVSRNYASVALLVDKNLAKRERDPWEFGKIIHAVEDFYSHSNYILLYRDFVAQNGNELVGSIPTLEEVLSHPVLYKSFITMLRRDLHTGRYPIHVWHVPDDTDHGYLIGQGLNKDTSNRPLFADARETSRQAAVWYLRLYLHDPEVTRNWFTLKSTLSHGAS